MLFAEWISVPHKCVIIMNGKILYKEICNDIVKKINQGEYKKGDYLPSQAELSEQYHTSLVTIKKAVEYAEQMGILVRCKGKRSQISADATQPSKYKILALNVIGKSFSNIKEKASEAKRLSLQIENTWYSQIVDSLISCLPSNVEFLEAAYYRDQVIENYEETLIPKYDRILLLGTKSQSLIDFLSAKGKKVALFGNTFATGCAVVANNDREISRMAVKYLISLGHKKIAFIGSDSSDGGDFAERYNGYREAMSTANLINDGNLIRWCKYAVANEGYENMLNILYASYYSIPTAVFCANDNIAYGVLKAIKEMGLNCPKDISVIGVDNTLEICKITEPTLSSIDKNFKFSGAKLAEILSREVWQNDRSLIKCDLVIRESTQEPKC